MSQRAQPFAWNSRILFVYGLQSTASFELLLSSSLALSPACSVQHSGMEAHALSKADKETSTRTFEAVNKEARIRVYIVVVSLAQSSADTASDFHSWLQDHVTLTKTNVLQKRTRARRLA